MLGAQQRACEVRTREMCAMYVCDYNLYLIHWYRPSLKRGARLGYMGHLITIFELLSENCRVNDEYRALVESSFDANTLDCDGQLADWQQIQAPEVGELVHELKLQKTFLVNLLFSSCGELCL